METGRFVYVKTMLVSELTADIKYECLKRQAYSSQEKKSELSKGNTKCGQILKSIEVT